MIRALLVFFAFVYSANGFGQDSVVVIVEIRSTTENETVQNVNATIEIGSNSFISSPIRRAYFPLKLKSEMQLDIN